MNRVKIRLDTFSDVQRFVDKVSSETSNVYLTDGKRFCVSAKSLLGAMCSIEWTEIYCESDKAIDHLIMDYIVLNDGK